VLDVKRAISIVVGVCSVIVCLRAYWPRPVAADQLSLTTVTFNREIVRILDNHCVACHSANGLSFPLETYEQTFVQGRAFRANVLNRHMPPWPAVAGYGDFANSNRMTIRESQFVVSWVDGMGPRTGAAVFLNVVDPKAVAPPEVRAHFDVDHWELGKPDLLLPVPANSIASHEADQVKQAVIDPKLTSDHWLWGLEYKPGDRRVVHAVFFKIQESGQWIGSWTPWYGFFRLPQGLAYRLPARSHIVAEIHYYGVKESAVDQGSLALYFADQPSDRAISELALAPRCVRVAGTAASQKCTAEVKLAEDTHVAALWPRIQSGAQSIELTARTPDGETQVLLLARDIPAAWPTPYILKSPISLSKDTQLSVTEYYGNASDLPPAKISLVVSGYEGPALTSSEPKVQQPVTPAAPTQHFKLAGTVRSVDAGSGSLVVQHSAIPGFMGAMTMSYRAATPEDLTKVAAGDQIQADLIVIGSDTHLENITVVNRPK
jgi:Cu/Ag efflux protein CusF